MSFRLCALASGSSGNSVYIGTNDTHILIDAGLSGKQLEANLSAINIHPNTIDAIFITHEHSDHIKGAGVMSRRYNIPLYATGGTWDAIQYSELVGKISLLNKRYVYNEENCIINDICIRPFEIPHDAVEPVGYSMYACGHKISVATDIGYATDIIKDNIADSSAILLESNHDIDMLMEGKYPEHLKRRILSKKGHLSNTSAAELITDVVSERLKYVFLGHLSEENNTPDIAFGTVNNILEGNKIPKAFELHMANRYTASKLVRFA